MNYLTKDKLKYIMIKIYTIIIYLLLLGAIYNAFSLLDYDKYPWWLSLYPLCIIVYIAYEAFIKKNQLKENILIPSFLVLINLIIFYMFQR